MYDPLLNSVIDLVSNQFQLFENDFALLVEEKAGIRRLIAEDVNIVHYHWVEQESFENSLVEVVAQLIKVVTYQLPINRKVDVTRNEYQSMASKNCKAKLKNSARVT
ncbi:21424_t:CDS:2, partial [Gigaspora margarita]